MTQHGFAREMLFTRETPPTAEAGQSEDNEIWFALSWNEDTYTVYPFHFLLHIGYRLEKNMVTIMWKVENRESNREMYFAIGGHPAFCCPLNSWEASEQYLLQFDNQKIEYYSLNEKGLLVKEPHSLPLTEGRYFLRKDTFDRDALVIEPYKARKISLCTPDGKPYVTVDFDSPSVGVYSQKGMRAPYLCIEPWYGRCDNEDFSGELREKEHIQCLKPGEEFKAAYKISFF